MQDALAVKAEGLVKNFGRTTALAGLDLAVPAGTVLGLLGPNGAGKTTLVRILTTLLKPDAGTAQVAGYNVLSEAAKLRSSIGLAGQYASVDEMLTGRENLELIGLWCHLSRAEYRRRAQELLERFTLTEAADKLVRTYSGGMRRRLDIAASLLGRPPVLFLDEPTTGLGPRTRNDLWSHILELVAGGTTVVLTTQYMEEADRLADNIVIIDHGRTVAEGTPTGLKSRVGGEVLEARVKDVADLPHVAAVFAEVGVGEPHSIPEDKRVSIPAKGGTSLLIAAGQRLEHDGIALDDLGIRRPSLDDVFLSLTGGSSAALEVTNPKDQA